MQGELTKQMLEENGVVAVLMNKQDSSFMFGKIDLLVNAEDAEEARKLIDANQPEQSNEN